VGVYTLTESGPAGYTAGAFSCSGGGALAGNLLTITAADSAKTITCSITNTFNVVAPAQLALAKTVVNTGGGSALASAFTLTATGPSVISGTAPVAASNAPVGVYTLTESGPAGYTAGAFSCSGGGALAGNLLTITAADAGNTITCSITNTFHPVLPTLTVSKVSNAGVNTFGFSGTNGFANQSITTVTSGSAVAAPTQTLSAAAVITTITEALPPANYTLDSISCTGLGAGGTATQNLAARSVTLDAPATAAASVIACTFNNTFHPVLPTVESIPTLSEWAMIMLASLMAWVGIATVRRQTR
jgi:hypothetical protein